MAKDNDGIDMVSSAEFTRHNDDSDTHKRGTSQEILHVKGESKFHQSKTAIYFDQDKGLTPNSKMELSGDCLRSSNHESPTTGSTDHHKSLPPLSPSVSITKMILSPKDPAVNMKSSDLKIHRSPDRSRSNSLDQPVTPVDSKMAEKIAKASSRADKTFNDLMSSVEFEEVMTSGALMHPLQSYHDFSRESHLIGGAFNTISNSSPEPLLGSASTSGLVTDSVQIPSEVMIPLPDIKHLNNEMEHSGSVEVQLSQLSQKEEDVAVNSPLHILQWMKNILDKDILQEKEIQMNQEINSNALLVISYLLDDEKVIDNLCSVVAYTVQQGILSVDPKLKETLDGTSRIIAAKEQLESFRLSPPDQRVPVLECSNFVSFLQKLSVISSIESPVKSNPIIDRFMRPEDYKKDDGKTSNVESMKELLFGNDTMMLSILVFMWNVCNYFENSVSESDMTGLTQVMSSMSASELLRSQSSESYDEPGTPQFGNRKIVEQLTTARRSNVRNIRNIVEDIESTPKNLYETPPTVSPCPFELAIWNAPIILSEILRIVGDPVTICRVKLLNKFCRRFVNENEYLLMRDAARLGGIPSHIRPSFWLHITLSRCLQLQDSEMDMISPSGVQPTSCLPDFNILELEGRGSKWHHIIERDVARAFGNMPPHKRGTRNKNSIVKALVSWGREHLLPRRTDAKAKDASHEVTSVDKPIRRIVMTSPMLGIRKKVMEMQQMDDQEIERTDTVSDWGGISPLDSQLSYNSVGSIARTDSIGDMVLCGNGLSNDMKVELQKKLESILNAIAAAHKGVGYCQGMDYVVAHLLRVLQETIEWNAQKNRLPHCIKSYQAWNTNRDLPLHETILVEESVFLVMHTFLCTYNLRHMYWPELRCLKSCCRIFSKIIEKKLPVLADHFEHHELNIGLFSLGWFQTLFLYIPSMPSKTINHMWDIWLVERSMKIFYRIGCAILFLSQPILLNNELEGMMTYLNTFPDATIFTSDILINCALQIKITNKMLSSIELEVIRENNSAHEKLKQT
jgi:hypothetical protein